MELSDRIAARLWEMRGEIEQKADEYAVLYQDERCFAFEWRRLVSREIQQFLPKRAMKR